MKFQERFCFQTNIRWKRC